MPADGYRIDRDDYGAFRAVEPGGANVVLLRPTSTGLQVERELLFELVPWAAVTGITLSRTRAGRANVPTATVHLEHGPPLVVANALTPGADQLPFSTEPGGPLLLRSERFRLLVATLVAGAGLAPTSPGQFRPSPRMLPLPELARRPRLLPGWAPPLLIVASVLGLVWFFHVPFWHAVAITAVVLVHEYGHAFAMKLFGLRVRGVLIIPFVGGGVVPEHAFPTRWDEARVALAGPLTGLPAALVGLSLYHLRLLPQAEGPLIQFIFWSVALNLLNLLPVLPLDGGRVSAALTAGLPRAPRAVLTYLPITLLLLVLAVYFPGNVSFLIAVGLAFCLFMTRSTLRRQSFHEWMQTGGLDLGHVRRALRDVTMAFHGEAREDVDGGVAPTPLSVDQFFIVLVTYAALVVALLITTWVVAPLLEDLMAILT